jgi:hypothetical protein
MGEKRRREEKDPGWGNNPYLIEVCVNGEVVFECYHRVQIADPSVSRFRNQDRELFLKARDGKATSTAILTAMLLAGRDEVEADLRDAVGEVVEEIKLLREDYHLAEFTGSIYRPDGSLLGGFSPSAEEYEKHHGASIENDADAVLEQIRELAKL